MNDRLRNRLDAGRQDEGFTLIELLIVIVILGILAAIVVFAVGGITDKGNKAACKADYKTVEVAQEAYYAKASLYTTPALLVAEKLIRSVPNSTAYVVDSDSTGAVYSHASGTANGAGNANENFCDTL